MDGMTLAALASADDYVQDVADHAAEIDRSGTFPWQSLDILQRERLLAITARREDGGEAAELHRASELVRDVGRGCASTGLILGMHLIHLRTSARSNWPEHLKARVGRSAGRFGSLINAAGGAGSRDARAWRLAGHDGVPGRQCLGAHRAKDL